ncbi:hypothetical protein TBLA_0B06590 [Henningerozyma blattae CBS 6284]|uniref:37S ribosomal protein S35, mitochondrial n=1 Tax=Henningerozyma blattae (strain ATCC 34711 / CBS 6284 / DSM 70876 / NBRC 10599 / NRRL Y-10934 / UCD 77-7) TaxID=1071380 RepID=I2GZD0_HENB6|nr:hypothetical protein TBLA_0B06590 [Tetrapisispora blattae CBS 6284]CCH59482.1 hypothetical protein TBLA_0B06590 [Tetrapisispora blattae CBS 6284]
MFKSQHMPSAINSPVRVQIRQMSRKRIAYPPSSFNAATQGKTNIQKNPKDHSTQLRHAMFQFLGPRNYKKEYVHNKYFAPPKTPNTTNFIRPDLERGIVLRNPVTQQPLIYDTVNKKLSSAPSNSISSSKNSSGEFRRQLQPFPQNPHCHTNYIVTEELKARIYEDIHTEGLSPQQVSLKYGLKVARVEAIDRLYKIEQNWENHGRIKGSLKKMANTMENLFPIFRENITKENLSELPVPTSALTSRFVTLPESQHFGALEAAEILGLEPAETTLKKLSEVDPTAENTTKKHKVVYGEVRQGDRSLWRFQEAKVGHVGVRYGRSNRDNKTDRKIGFDSLGRMIYI